MSNKPNPKPERGGAGWAATWRELYLAAAKKLNPMQGEKEGDFSARVRSLAAALVFDCIEGFEQIRGNFPTEEQP